MTWVLDSKKKRKRRRERSVKSRDSKWSHGIRTERHLMFARKG